jgi:hypothetical protein
MWKTFVTIFAITLSLWVIKPPLISGFVSTKIRVPVVARMVSIWPTRTLLRYFFIRNPHGYKDKAFKAKKIEIDYAYSKLTSIPSEIDQITISDAVLNVQIEGPKENNWLKIGSKIHGERSARRVIIHKLVVNNLTVHTTGKGAISLGVAGTQQFDQMEFDEIDSANGFPTSEVIGKIFGRAGVGDYIHELLNPAERIEQTLFPF